MFINNPEYGILLWQFKGMKIKYLKNINSLKDTDMFFLLFLFVCLLVFVVVSGVGFDDSSLTYI